MPYSRIVNILQEEKIPFQEIDHEATTSCEHSTEMRKAQGLDGVGSKCVLMKASKSGRVFLAVTMGSVDIHKKMLKPVLGEKEFRFADREMLNELMEVEPGCAYPFSHNPEILTLVDEEIFKHEYFIFTPGLHTKSIQVKTADLKKIYDKHYPNVMYFSSKTEEE